MCRSSSEGYDVASFMGLVPVWGKGKWERRTGTKLLAVLLQHICCEVNSAHPWVGKRGKRNIVAKVIERVDARYKVQDVENGKVYQ